MIYGFVTDESLYNRIKKMSPDEDINQGVGYFTEKAQGYYNTPASVPDVRVTRLKILEDIINDTMSIRVDKDQTKEIDIENLDHAVYSQLFNIIELCYLSQHKTAEDLDKIMINEKLKYGIYVKDSLVLSAGVTKAKVAISRAKIIEDVEIRHAITFKAIINEAEIGVTIWLNEKTFLANYPITTIKAVIHSMSPAKYLTLDYKNILDALKESASQMLTTQQKFMQKDRFTNLHIYNTTYVPEKTMDPCQLPFGIIYKGRDPLPTDIRPAIREDLLKRKIVDEERWKKIFPDLWVNGRFFMIPMWKNTHVVNSHLTLYMSTLRDKEVTDVLKTIFPNYDKNFITTNSEITNVACSMIHTTTLPDEGNEKTELSLREIFPTYQAVDSKNQAFKYQSDKARKFNLLLNAAIARLIGATNDIKFEEVKLGGRQYLVFTTNYLDFYVLFKEDYPKNINDIRI